MAEMESDIHKLDADLQAKTASLKLAHTRLENRTSRPGMDLCRDEVQIYSKHILKHIKVGNIERIPSFLLVCLQVQHGLVNEVHQLEATILALKQKLSEAQ